ncbi:MAG TPA: Gfo/Idh/MocA family oxidoreductase [Chloroflexota bacterium]|nr:Gfo/Idh/MocA family oxidoreductase [Chloroflexota bacterium]
MTAAPDRPLRVGVIGTGFGAQVHVPAFRESPDFEVVAIVSGRRDNAERVAAQAQVAWFSDDYRAMLRDVDLDVVSVAVPGALHHEIVLAAAAAGRHILCEKPFATSVFEGQEMLAAVRAAGVGHAINHEFRMIPARQAFRRLVVEEGVLGTMYDVRGIVDLSMLLNPTRGWSWWSDRTQYGGLMQAMTSHLIDFLLWTFGDIATLSASVDTFIRTRQTHDGTQRQVTSDDQNAALLHFTSGATGLIHVSGISRISRSIVEAHGSAASLSIDGSALRRATEPGKLEAIDLQPLSTSGGDERVQLMVAYLAHVARVFRGQPDPQVATFEQGLRVQAVMDAMHRSADNGGALVTLQQVATSAR